MPFHDPSAPTPFHALARILASEPYLRRVVRATGVLTLAFAAVVAAWPGLYKFGKVLNLPTWAQGIPGSFHTASYLAFPFLLVTALLSKRLTSAVCLVTIVAWLGPALGLLPTFFAALSAEYAPSPLTNYIFHCVFASLFWTTQPAGVALAIRLCARDVPCLIVRGVRRSRDSKLAAASGGTNI
jgi:hypothetical protein